MPCPVTAHLVKRFGILVETAVGLLQAVVDRVEGRFDGILKGSECD
jgi:hypothetical protein